MESAKQLKNGAFCCFCFLLYCDIVTIVVEVLTKLEFWTHQSDLLDLELELELEYITHLLDAPHCLEEINVLGAKLLSLGF